MTRIDANHPAVRAALTAEKKQRNAARAARAALAARNPHLSAADQRALNGQYEDQADVLLAVLRTHAADLAQLAEREYPFGPYHIDIAFTVPRLVAVEVDGGRWARGGGKHMTPGDYKKTNALTLAGWRLLRYLPEMITADPLAIIADIREALR